VSDLPRHEPQPGLFEPILRPFQPTAGQRLTGRLLLRALRIPGVIVLLRRWHARRGRADRPRERA
jgi:hypothetical protein